MHVCLCTSATQLAEIPWVVQGVFTLRMVHMVEYVCVDYSGCKVDLVLTGGGWRVQVS